MQLVSYQKQVCVCGTWTAGEVCCDMVFFTPASPFLKEAKKMTSTLGGKCSLTTKSTLAVTGVITDDLSLESLAWTRQPLLHT